MVSITLMSRISVSALLNLDKAFKELANEMTKFASLEPDVHATYKKMVNDYLIKAMQKRMGG